MNRGLTGRGALRLARGRDVAVRLQVPGHAQGDGHAGGCRGGPRPVEVQVPDAAVLVQRGQPEGHAGAEQRGQQAIELHQGVLAFHVQRRRGHAIPVRKSRLLRGQKAAPDQHEDASPVLIQA